MINFFYNYNNFSLQNEKQIKYWISKCIENHGFDEGEISYTLMSDNDLLEINKEMLNHDFYTDIITIDQSIDDILSGDIFISIDRVKENAEQMNINFNEEILRVLIHGILHIVGFNDHKETDKKQMRAEEDNCISKFQQTQ
jgi:rRNA maturation RNase YbeY